jgi:hypothetical protein
VTSTLPALPTGDVVEILVELVTVNVAALAPNDTAVAPVKAVPVMVTGVPPAVVPELGVRALTVGAGGTVTVIAVERAP